MRPRQPCAESRSGSGSPGRRGSLVPTFNGRPTLANSTEPVERRGVLPERATAYRGSLDEATIEAIEHAAGDVYERAVAAAGVPAVAR